MYIRMSDFCKLLDIHFPDRSCKPTEPDLYNCALELTLIPDGIALERHLWNLRGFNHFEKSFPCLSRDQFGRLVSACSALGLVERSIELLRMRQELFPSEAVSASPSFRL